MDLLKPLQNGLIKKNLMLISKYFFNADLRRLGLNFNIEYGLVEENLCELILEDYISGKIDRPNQIITF